MYSINASSNSKNIFIKKKDLYFAGFPKIHFPFHQKKHSNLNTFKDVRILKKNNTNFNKIQNISSYLKQNEKFLRQNSNPGNHIYHLFKKNRHSAENIFVKQKDKILENLDKITIYNSLAKIWEDFNVSIKYRDFFNLILNKLDEGEREDICMKEFKELSELKNNIISLVKEIELRKKSLGKLYELNNLLENDFKEEENYPNNEIIKEITEQIINLRLHSVNICFKMKKIKNRIYEGYLYGKYDFDEISKKFAFDKDYLVKMKEELNFLKNGKIKYYFNIGNNSDPFLIKASENINNLKQDEYVTIVPLSKELEESIKQCNYFIYQELIYYQTKNNRKNFLLNYPEEIYNESMTEKNYLYEKNITNRKFKEDIINNDYNNNEFNKQNILSDRNEKVNSKERDESILFEENRINMNEILSEKTNNKNMYDIQKLNSKNSDKKIEKSLESQISRISILTSNASRRVKSSYHYKNLKVIIYEGYIYYFIENFFNDYYNHIPKEEIKMFNLQSDISSSMLNGITPFILLIKEGINNNQINENENLYGCCIFNYEKENNNKLKIRINHISAIAEKSYNDYKDNLKYIYQMLLKFIINKFYFDEIFIEFSKDNQSELLLKIFKEFDFIEKSILKSNGGDDASNNGQIKLNYLIFKNIKELNDSARNSLKSFYGNNLFHFFNSILLSNSDRDFNINNYNGNDFVIPKEIQDINNIKYKESNLFINLAAIKVLFQTNKIHKISKLYQRITSLDKLIKIFSLNKIDKNEIPLAAAENRYNLIGFVLDKIINSILINSSKLVNNYNLFSCDSYLDEESGIYYNFMKPDMIYELYDENLQINFYIIINNKLAIFFIKFNNQIINKDFLTGENIYSQINDIYTELIINKKIHILKNKIIWIPCFEVFRHFKCLINNNFFTVHEYICISNKIINTYQRMKKEKAYELLFSNNLSSFNMEPEENNDIILDNNFFIGIINNADYFNKIYNNKSFEEKENLDSVFSPEDKIDIMNNNENIQNFDIQIQEENNEIKNIKGEEFPNIIFLNYIKRTEFIQASS